MKAYGMYWGETGPLKMDASKADIPTGCIRLDVTCVVAATSTLQKLRRAGPLEQGLMGAGPQFLKAEVV